MPELGDDSTPEPFIYRVLLSGGMDSAIALACAVYLHGHSVDAVFFDYGQRAAEQEQEAARFLARHYRVKLHEVELNLEAKPDWRASSLTSTGSLHGERVIVPGRNLALIEEAAAIFPFPAEICIAVCEDDGPLFEDCRPAFYKELNETLQSNGATWQVHTPFIYFSKPQLYQWAKRFGGTAILQHTWSCYEGHTNGKPIDAPCGKCLSCEEVAFALAGTYGGY